MVVGLGLEEYVLAAVVVVVLVAGIVPDADTDRGSLLSLVIARATEHVIHLVATDHLGSSPDWDLGMTC